MNPNKQKIDLAIIQLTDKLGKLPEVWQIEKYTGFSAILIIRNLDKDYPKNLLMSQNERTVLKAYLEDHRIKIIAEKVGNSYYNVSNTITRLIQKGFIKRPPSTKEYVKTKSSNTFIEVTSDVFINKGKTVTINLNGGRGYIDPKGVNNSCCIFKDKKLHHVDLVESQYRVVRRAVE